LTPTKLAYQLRSLKLFLPPLFVKPMEYATDIDLFT